MNVTFSIIVIVSFAIIGEVITWIERNQNIFNFGYASMIRIVVLCFSICIIDCVNDELKDCKFLNEANSFKYELFQHQDSLINYQRTMIDNLANHLWNEHDCDIPQFDGDLKDKIDFEEQYLDSLYNTRL